VTLLDKVFEENGGNVEGFHAVMQLVLDGNDAAREELVCGFTEMLQEGMKHEQMPSRVELLMLLDLLPEAINRAGLK
jgi:hypothetical protein